MKNYIESEDYNLYLMDKEDDEMNYNLKQERKNKSDREKRIKKYNKDKRQEDNKFDFDTETVIGMTNRNNIIKENQKKRLLSRKEEKLKKKRKKRKRIIKFITFIILIVGSLIFATTSPIFNIKYIEVINNNQIDTNTIISISGLSIDQNIFKFLKKNIKSNIKENAYIQDVTIKRVLPNKVHISVQEREKKFSLQFLNGYAYINSQGYILEISEDKLDLPVLQGAATAEEDIVPGNRLCSEDLEKLEMVIKIMDSAKENNLDSKVTSIDVLNKNEYNIYIEEEQKTIHLGDATNLTNRMIRVQAILEAEKGIAGDIFVNGDFNNKFKAYFREKV